MMTSHGKLRKEKGSLAEYESQMKGTSLCVCVFVSVCAMCLSLCASVPFHHTSVCALSCVPEFI